MYLFETVVHVRALTFSKWWTSHERSLKTHFDKSKIRCTEKDRSENLVKYHHTLRLPSAAAASTYIGTRTSLNYQYCNRAWWTYFLVIIEYIFTSPMTLIVCSIVHFRIILLVCLSFNVTKYDYLPANENSFTKLSVGTYRPRSLMFTEDTSKCTDLWVPIFSLIMWFITIPFKKRLGNSFLV